MLGDREFSVGSTECHVHQERSKKRDLYIGCIYKYTHTNNRSSIKTKQRNQRGGNYQSNLSRKFPRTVGLEGHTKCPA